MNAPACPACNQNDTYQDNTVWVCPHCAHEWQDEVEAEAATITDAHGAALADGDSVVLIKDLKVKGSSTVIKQGTKVKNIRLQSGDHDIACKIDGSAMNLKSAFVKKA